MSRLFAIILCASINFISFAVVAQRVSEPVIIREYIDIFTDLTIADLFIRDVQINGVYYRYLEAFNPDHHILLATRIGEASSNQATADILRIYSSYFDHGPYIDVDIKGKDLYNVARWKCLLEEAFAKLCESIEAQHARACKPLRDEEI